MDRLRAMEVFVAVAEAGGLARAGARLGMSPPAVTRAVAMLEERLGTRLLNRTTRRLSLTEAGVDQPPSSGPGGILVEHGGWRC